MLRLCMHRRRALGLCARTARLVSTQASTEPNRKDIKPFSAIPGPKPLPILGNLLKIRQNSSSMRLYVEKCLKEYGGIFKLRYPGGCMVYMANPNTLEAVLRAEGKYPSRSRDMDEKMAWFFTHLGYRVPLSFMSDEEWKELRTAIGKQTLPRNVNSYIPGMTSILQRFTRYLKANRDEKGYVEDIADLLNKLLMELSASFVYDKNLSVVDSSDKDALAFIKAVQTLLGSVVKVGFEPPIYKIFPTKLYRDMSGAIKDLYGFGMKYAKELQASNTRSGGALSLLEQWLTEGKVSEEHAIILSIDMFGAGVDTTSNTATFMLHGIATNPEVEEKLHAEISSVLGDSKLPTAEDLAAMPYVKGIVKETLRLYSVAAAVPRTLQEDMVVMGYHIPAKDILGDAKLSTISHLRPMSSIYATYTSGRDEQLFKNPEKFDPDRWSKDDIGAFAQLPFGFGPRSCYGRRFAELELKLILIEMARTFKLHMDLQELPQIEGALVRPDGAVPLQLIDRK